MPGLMPISVSMTYGFSYCGWVSLNEYAEVITFSGKKVSGI